MTLHITGIKTANDVELQQVWDYQDTQVLAETDPDLIPLVQYYTRFNLSKEQLGRTGQYNCHGFTFLPRRYWINSASDVDQILNDNCTPVTPGSLRPGDVIRYRDSNSVTTHTGRVWEVDDTGNCVKVRSKWGNNGEYVHAPDDSHIYGDSVYGTNLSYFRQQAPLRGAIGDLWIADGSDDTGEEYSDSAWASPDILADSPNGSVDENPVCGQVNHVRAVVHNRGETNIDNARVRYYWADASAGFAPPNWQLIPGTPGHPNPTDPFTVPALSSAQAPDVEWVPVRLPGTKTPPCHCLLAIAYVNEDAIMDPNDPDPIVYPFDVRWDNNIAARNVHVVSLSRKDIARLVLGGAVPVGQHEHNADLWFGLAFVPRFPIFGFPPDVILPEVRITLGGRRPFVLAKPERIRPFGKVWGPTIKPREFDSELFRGGGRRFPFFRMTEKTVAWRQIKRIPVAPRKPVPLQIEITAPRKARAGTNFSLRIEQGLRGKVSGCYTVVVSIV